MKPSRVFARLALALGLVASMGMQAQTQYALPYGWTGGNGTSGQCLTSNGSVLLPSFQACGTGGLAPIPPSTLLGNNTGSTAAPSALAVLPLSLLSSSSGTSVTFLGAVPEWVHIGNALTFSTFSAAATTNSVALFTLPAGGVIHAIKIKHSTAFSGGAISGYTVSVGISGNLAKYASAFSVSQAIGGGVFQLTNELFAENDGATTAVLVTAVSMGANLSAATAGAVDIYALLSVAL